MNPSRIDRRWHWWMLPAALAALLAALALALTLAFDPDRWRGDIEQAVLRATGRTLHFDGPLTLSLLPRPALQLPPTTLSDRDGGAVMARLQTARAAFALGPLLQRRIAITALTVTGLDATVDWRADGSSSIDDLLGRAPPVTPSTPTAAPAPSVSVGPPAPTSPAASLPAPAATPFRIEVDRIALADARLYVRQVGIRTLALSAAQLQASGLQGDQMQLALRAHIASDVPALAGALQVDGGIGIRASHALQGLTARFDGTLDGTPLAVQLDAPRVQIEADRASGDPVQVRVQTSGADALDVRLQLRGLAGNASTLSIERVAISATSASPQRRVVLDVATPATLELDTRRATLSALSGSVQAHDPTLPGGVLQLPLAGSLRIDGRAGSAALALDSKAAESAFTLRANATAGDAPHVQFDLQADRVQLETWFPPVPARGAAPPAAAATAKPAAAGTDAATTAVVGAGALVRTSANRPLALDGTVRIGTLSARGLTLTQVQSGVRARAGTTDLAPLTASLYGGRLEAHVRAQPQGGALTVAGTLSDVALQPLLRAIGQRDVIEGRASAKADLAVGNLSAPAPLRTLRGTASIAVRDGAVRGIDLERVLSQAATRLGVRGAAVAGSTTGDRTPFESLTASFAVRDGVATNDDLAARSALLLLAGRGRIDLAAGTLDYALKVQPEPAGTLGRLRGVGVPVTLTGPFDKIAWSVDWSAAAGDVAKEELLKRLAPRDGDPGAKPADQIRKRLEDLLRR